MSANIILNKNHINNFYNSELRYEFNKPHTFNKGDTIAVSHINLFYSWFNITSYYNNNKFQYVWWDANGELTNIVDVIIPDGYYSVNTLNEFLQSIMVKNKHYLSNGSNNIYFIEFLTNTTYYSIEIRLSSLKTIEEFGNNVVLPSNATWILPIEYQTPKVNILSNNNFHKYLGFYPRSFFQDLTVQPASTSQYSFLNEFTPTIDPSSSFIITCNLVDNLLSSPSDVITAFTTPNNVNIGDLISLNSDIVYSKIKEGTYREIIIKIYDQDFNLMQIKDNNMLFVLSILKQDI